MPGTSVDVFVEQGSFNQATAAQSIGTDGCTTCVGVVAVMKDQTKHCAHFDCEAASITQEQRTAIQDRTAEILNEQIPSKDQIETLKACSTAVTFNSTTNAYSGLESSSGAIWLGIKDYFANAELLFGNGIYALSNGTIGTVGFSSNVTGLPAPENTFARIS